MNEKKTIYLKIILVLHEYHCTLKCCPVQKTILWPFRAAVYGLLHGDNRPSPSHELLSGQAGDGNGLEGDLTHSKHGVGADSRCHIIIMYSVCYRFLLMSVLVTGKLTLIMLSGMGINKAHLHNS